MARCSICLAEIDDELAEVVGHLESEHNVFVPRWPDGDPVYFENYADLSVLD